MRVIHSNPIYENPLPQLRSRQSAFPFVCELPDGSLLASHVISEAFESVDATSYTSISTDGGKTWSKPKPMFDKSKDARPNSDCCKITLLPDGRLIALGYAFYRDNPELALANPETGGLLDDYVFYSISEDNGETWGPMVEIPCTWGPHVEASAPLYVLADGSWGTPITGFPKWDGTMTSKHCGRFLRTEDQGKTWNDDAVCMDFDVPTICYEQRTCKLASGTLVTIGWNEEAATGKRLNNHFTYSTDNGKTWSAPITTGIQGQASSVCAIGGERLLALHGMRRDTDRPGIYAYIVDFSEKTWNIVEHEVVWEPSTPTIRNKFMAEIFSLLKFGQPGAIQLKDGSILMTHWCANDGQYSTVATKIEL